MSGKQRRRGESGRLVRLKSRAPSWLAGALALALVSPAASQSVRNPRRIAEGVHGQLLVADRTGWIVAVDKGSLEPVWSFQLPEEQAPFGLASWGRLVFVGNTETWNVEVYRMHRLPNGGMELRFQYNLGHPPPGETGTIEKPISIAVDRKERLVFVLDGREKRVKIFDRAGTLTSSWAPVDSSGEVLSPVSVAVDEIRREVLVGDYGDPSGSFSASTPARILIYDYLGELLFQIDGDASTAETTQFARVQGLAPTRDGRIFAADPLANLVLVLDRSTGALLDQVGTEGQEPGELMLPLDVLLDKSGDLFVSNNQGARKVEVFRGVGRRP